MSATPEPIDIANLRFLVVEDHGFQRWALGHVLEEMGARQVLFAQDGESALEILRAPGGVVDIIISDLDMPAMDGMEFIRHVAEAGTPASLVLASGLDKSLVASVEMMARAYGVTLLGALSKPVTAEKLSEVLGRHRPVSLKPPPAADTVFTSEQISEAIQRGEFTAYYQPKVDLATGVLRGAEAVARWQHPTKGMIPPHAFVRTLEASYQIHELTMSILRTASAACRHWRRAGIDATVSVNVSLVSLSDVSLAERLTEVVESEGITPHEVIVEVTETAAASHLGKVLENLSRLRMKGFGLAIDDYGTGYASMQQLTRIPFTELKIDQSFVRNAPTQRSSRAVLESSLEIASKLRIASVAEGVETKEQVVMLRELGCQMAQGFFIAKPMPAADFVRWAQDHARA
jgi:EAL domain-containing protein (putative c-di-GMP-specific phosphodiesterase class I)